MCKMCKKCRLLLVQKCSKSSNHNLFFPVFFQLHRKQILRFDSCVSRVSVRELCVVCVKLQWDKLGIFAFSRARQETLDQTKVITDVKRTTR